MQVHFYLGKIRSNATLRFADWSASDLYAYAKYAVDHNARVFAFEKLYGISINGLFIGVVRYHNVKKEFKLQ